MFSGSSWNNIVNKYAENGKNVTCLPYDLKTNHINIKVEGSVATNHIRS